MENFRWTDESAATSAYHFLSGLDLILADSKSSQSSISSLSIATRSRQSVGETSASPLHSLVMRRLSRLQDAKFRESQDSRTDSPFPEDDFVDSARRRLADLTRLGQNWDSYGAVPPTSTAIDGALQFIDRAGKLFWRILGERARPTSISPLPSGGIELEWRLPAEFLAIDIGPEGRWGYLRRSGSGRTARAEEREGLTDDQLLPVLANFLRTRA